MSPDNVNGGLRARQVERFGWVPDLPDARDYMYSAPEAILSKMPKKVDLRGSNMPPVYDQGSLGSCTANAIGAAFEFGQVKQGMKDFMPSRLFIYYNERAMEGTIDTDSGAMIRDGMKSVAKVGVCTEVTWPYDIPKFTEKPPTKAYTEAKKHQALVYRRVLGNLHQMQGCLALHEPRRSEDRQGAAASARRAADRWPRRARRRLRRLEAGVHRPQLLGREMGHQGLLRDALRLPHRPTARP